MYTYTADDMAAMHRAHDLAAEVGIKAAAAIAWDCEQSAWRAEDAARDAANAKRVANVKRTKVAKAFRVQFDRLRSRMDYVTVETIRAANAMQRSLDAGIVDASLVSLTETLRVELDRAPY